MERCKFDSLMNKAKPRSDGKFLVLMVHPMVSVKKVKHMLTASKIVLYHPVETTSAMYVVNYFIYMHLARYCDHIYCYIRVDIHMLEMFVI